MEHQFSSRLSNLYTMANSAILADMFLLTANTNCFFHCRRYEMFFLFELPAKLGKLLKIKLKLHC